MFCELYLQSWFRRSGSRGEHTQGFGGTPGRTLGGWSTWACFLDGGAEKPVLVLTACHERGLEGCGGTPPRGETWHRRPKGQAPCLRLSTAPGGEDLCSQMCPCPSCPRPQMWPLNCSLAPDFLFWLFFQETEEKSLFLFSKKRTIWEKTDRPTLGFHCSHS